MSTSVMEVDIYFVKKYHPEGGGGGGDTFLGLLGRDTDEAERGVPLDHEPVYSAL